MEILDYVSPLLVVPQWIQQGKEVIFERMSVMIRNFHARPVFGTAVSMLWHQADLPNPGLRPSSWVICK
jgi:hypothetical protein